MFVGNLWMKECTQYEKVEHLLHPVISDGKNFLLSLSMYVQTLCLQRCKIIHKNLPLVNSYFLNSITIKLDTLRNLSEDWRIDVLDQSFKYVRHL